MYSVRRFQPPHNKAARPYSEVAPGSRAFCKARVVPAHGQADTYRFGHRAALRSSLELAVLARRWSALFRAGARRSIDLTRRGLHVWLVCDARFRALLGRFFIMREIARSVDQRQVGKGLREISDQPAGARLILLAQEPEVVA